MLTWTSLSKDKGCLSNKLVNFHNCPLLCGQRIFCNIKKRYLMQVFIMAELRIKILISPKIEILGISARCPISFSHWLNVILMCWNDTVLCLYLTLGILGICFLSSGDFTSDIWQNPYEFSAGFNATPCGVYIKSILASYTEI